MYFKFLARGNALDHLTSLGFSSVPMLNSSISDLKGSILVFLVTSLESKRSSNGANPLGKKNSLRFKTSNSSLINSSISNVSNFSISTLVNLVGSILFTSLHLSHYLWYILMYSLFLYYSFEILPQNS